jgi:predicted phosphodiesterase
MKLAVLADIHSNLPALERVIDHVEQWQPDRVIVAGDIVNRGPRPVECLQLILDRQRRAGWQTVLGNHEQYVMEHAQPDAPRSGPRFEIQRISYWTYQQLRGDVSALAAMPLHVELPALNGSGPVEVYHASIRGTRDGIFTRSSDERLRRQIDPQASVFVVGHTHVPLVRQIDQTLIVNCGSVGLPFDGDPRAAYAQIVGAAGQWSAAIVRLEYDRDRADRDFELSGFIDEAGPIARLVRDELRHAHSDLFEWTNRYQERVVNGTLLIDAAVDQFLESR